MVDFYDFGLCPVTRALGTAPGILQKSLTLGPLELRHLAKHFGIDLLCYATLPP